MAIVHGKSELLICQHIKSNLRLKHEIIAEKHGKHSIQINGLQSYLQKFNRMSPKKFAEDFGVEIQKQKLLNFKLFIIMDTDDCTESTKEAYINKMLFKDSWLCDYIVPIYNSPDLETTMHAIGFEIRNKKDYIEVFPTANGDMDMKMAEDFCARLEKCKCSNLHIYVKHCLEIAKQDKIK